jgi:hypothetical protein
MPFWMFVRLEAAAGRVVATAGRRAARAKRRAGGQAGSSTAGGFSTAEGLAGAALAVVALIAIWAAMRAFGLDIIRWMQDQITSSGGGT